MSGNLTTAFTDADFITFFENIPFKDGLYLWHTTEGQFRNLSDKQIAPAICHLFDSGFFDKFAEQHWDSFSGCLTNLIGKTPSEDKDSIRAKIFSVKHMGRWIEKYGVKAAMFTDNFFSDPSYTNKDAIVLALIHLDVFKKMAQERPESAISFSLSCSNALSRTNDDMQYKVHRHVLNPEFLELLSARNSGSQLSFFFNMLLAEMPPQYLEATLDNLIQTGALEKTINPERPKFFAHDIIDPCVEKGRGQPRVIKRLLDFCKKVGITSPTICPA